MPPFWNNNFGKLVIGGCGTQVGLLLGLGMLIMTLLFCGICAFANVVSLGLTQEFVQAVPASSVQASLPPAEIALLQERVDLLTGKLIALRASAPYVPTPTPLPPPPLPRPIVIAQAGAVNLRSGPSDNYFRVGRLAKGESLEIVGRNQDSSWWLVVTPEGYFAWVCNNVVATYNLDGNIPVVAIPALLTQPNAGGSPVASNDPPPPVATAMAPASGVLPAAVSLPGLPAGTPTAPASASRRFVQDTLGYKQLIRRLLLPTVSESFSPDGAQIAITEKVKLYTITADGANSRVLLEDDDKIDLVGGVVWSPDGQYLAFVAKRLQGCTSSCGTVGLVRLGDGVVTLLKPPPGLNLDLPRWTQDGRILVNAQGTVYVYDTSGQSQAATGSYLLSSSHDGQKWFPWQPGKNWPLDPSRPVDSYYGDE